MSLPAALVAASVLAAWSGGTLFGQDKAAEQDRYSLKVPNGLAFAEFRGYQEWQTVAASQSGDTIEVILANPVMIAAYQAGIPGNGKPFPDGSKITKIHWTATPSKEAPTPTTVPGPLRNIDFIVKEAKRFPDTGGWGYAQFNYDPAAAKFAPDGTGSNCGYACHTLVTPKDYIFTAYPTR